MKKFNYIFFSLLALLFVTSCEEPQDKNPVLQTPTKFVLNNPVMSTQYIELTPTTTVNLSCSQPDYGYASATNYYAQVSFTEDFAEYAEVNENPYTNCAKMEVSGEELAKFQKLVDALEDLDDVQDVYHNVDLPEEDEE